MAAAFWVALRNWFAVFSTSARVISNGSAMPSMATVPISSGCLAMKAATSAGSAASPMSSATSSVKKSQGATKRSTVERLMWSASNRYSPVQPRSATALSAAWRVWMGSEPMMLCSRLDLFQTGVMSMPSFLASMKAASWAWAPLAKRSPTPNVYLGQVFIEMD